MTIKYRFENELKKAFSLMGIDADGEDYLVSITPDIENSSYEQKNDKTLSASDVVLYRKFDGHYDLQGEFEFIVEYEFPPVVVDVTLIDKTPIGEGKTSGETVSFRDEDY